MLVKIVIHYVILNICLNINYVVVFLFRLNLFFRIIENAKNTHSTFLDALIHTYICKPKKLELWHAAEPMT